MIWWLHPCLAPDYLPGTRPRPLAPTRGATTMDGSGPPGWKLPRLPCHTRGATTFFSTLTVHHIVDWYPWITRTITLFDPGIAWVLAVGERLGTASQDIQIVGGVARWAAHWVVAFGYKYDIVIQRQQHCIDGETSTMQRRLWSGVNTLKGKPFRAV